MPRRRARLRRDRPSPASPRSPPSRRPTSRPGSSAGSRRNAAAARGAACRARSARGRRRARPRRARRAPRPSQRPGVRRSVAAAAFRQPVPARRPVPRAAPARTSARHRRRPLDADQPRQSRPSSNEEKAQAGRLHEFDFLNSFETLARLDAFFPEPVGPRAPGVRSRRAASRRARPTRPTPSRAASWTGSARARRSARGSSRSRRPFRNRPEDERALLEDRWMLVNDFSEEQQAGLRRLASRLDEVDARAHDRLESEIRLIGRLPKDRARRALARAPLREAAHGPGARERRAPPPLALIVRARDAPAATLRP